MVDLSYVKPKNKLKRDQYNNELKKQIIQKMKEFDNLGSLKFDNELLKFVCSCLENSLKPKYEKKQKTDKKALVIEIFNDLFNLNEDEKKKLSNNIDFLIENELVQKINVAKKIGVIGFNYLKSKL
jgi:hypothetical protein